MTMKTNDDQQTSQEDTPSKPESLSLIQTIKSVLWAMLGIQKKENRLRDFTHGNAKNFIITALIFVFLFVFSLILIVQFVVRLA